MACARAADLGGGGREGAVVLEDGALRAGEAGEDARRAAHDADGGDVLRVVGDERVRGVAAGVVGGVAAVDGRIAAEAACMLHECMFFMTTGPDPIAYPIPRGPSMLLVRTPERPGAWLARAPPT